jgi:glycosyltransferase involved in cell wall biosynthesis
MASLPEVSVVMPTRNRSQALRQALASIYQQEGNFEVIVIDDASEDDTVEMVRREFPDVHLVENSEPQGVVIRRNQGAEMATAPIMLSIDDDAEFKSPTGLRDAVAALDHPRVGAVAFPIQNIVAGNPRPLQLMPPTSNDIWCTAHFIGAGYAMWRKLFLHLGGYDTSIYYGEEEILCRRLISAGYVVRAVSMEPIHHYPGSGLWSESDRSYLGYRNRLISTTLTTPTYALPAGWLHTAGRTLYGMAKAGSHLSRSKKILKSFGQGIVDSWKCRGRRTPMHRGSYRAYLRLRRHWMIPLSQVEPSLGPMALGPANELRS